jgi:putative transposase
MESYESLNHTKWECKYHLVWIPKYRKKTLYGQLRKELGPVFRQLAFQKETEIVEGGMKVDHVHMLVSIPPKYSVAQVVGYVKGKSAIWVARATGRKRNFVGQNFWARGYCVSTIGLDEKTIQEYIRAQEEADKKLDQLRMFD